MRLEEIDANWTPPDGLGYGGLRPVRLAAGGYAILVFAFLFTIGAFALGAFLWNQSQEQGEARARLEREGVSGDATITRVWHTGGKSDTPRLSYTFEAGGRPVPGRSDAPRNIFRTLKAGDHIPVRYVPADPEINHPAAWPMPVTPAWIIAVVPVTFIGVAVLFAWMVRKQWLLLSEGRPAPGIVTKARRVKNQKILHYEFRTMNGAIQKGRSNARRLYGIGEPVCVVYDPENPRASQIYPFQFVKLVR